MSDQIPAAPGCDDDRPPGSLSADEAHYLCHGNPVGHAARGIEGLVRVYDKRQTFIGVARVLPDGRIAPKRLFLGR